MTAVNFVSSVTLKQIGVNTLMTVKGGGAAGGTIQLNNATLANITSADFKLA